MAVIKPFRGVRYNPERFDDMQALVSQPYDKISDDLQDRYYALSPYNITRIIKGKADPADSPDGANVYTRAKRYYDEWLAEEALIRDDQPAFYAYEQTFTVEGQEYTRLGMIAAVALTPFEEGTILPHERTHGGPKADRLRLLQTMQVQTEEIFILYPDHENKVNRLIRQAIGTRAPDIDVVELFESGVQQRLWAITDPDIVAAIEAEMAPKRNLIIADGHHRYETGLNYSAAMRQAHPDAPADATFNFIAAAMVSMDDPGLVVLPTHREIHSFTDGPIPAEILERAAEHFDVSPAADLDACLATVNANPASHTFGFYGGAEVGYHTLRLKDAALLDTLIPDGHSPAWKSLDVSILHKVLLEQVAAVPAEGIDKKTMIRYHRSATEPVENIDNGAGQFVFFISATLMDKIKTIAGQGEKMPQKSTDFYPKIVSGLVMFPVTAEACK